MNVGSQPDLDREKKVIGGKRIFGIPRPVLDRTSTTDQPVPQLVQSVEPFFGSTINFFNLKPFKISLKNI